MKIKLAAAGRRFNRDWIFRKATLSFTAPIAYAITGPNGSGKSTLLQCISTALQLSEGSLSFEMDNRPVAAETAFRQLSFCAPYLDLIEELTLTEFLQFHQQFKPLLPGLAVPDVIRHIGLDGAAHKQLRYYSSGMKQRVRLAQAIFSYTPAVLLDEPCSNLDMSGIALYHSLIATFCTDRLVIVCSNDEVEYRFCQEQVSILDYK